MSEMQQLEDDFVSGNWAPSFLREAPKKRKGKSINKKATTKGKGRKIKSWLAQKHLPEVHNAIFEIIIIQYFAGKILMVTTLEHIPTTTIDNTSSISHTSIVYTHPTPASPSIVCSKSTTESIFSMSTSNAQPSSTSTFSVISTHIHLKYVCQ